MGVAKTCCLIPLYMSAETIKRASDYRRENMTELFKNYPDLVSVEELMDMLHIGKVLAYKLVENKKFKAVKIGREYKIIKQSVIDYINAEVQ